MIAVSFGHTLRAMLFSESGHRIDIGTFDLHVAVDSLFFIGTQVHSGPTCGENAMKVYIKGLFTRTANLMSRDLIRNNPIFVV
jgi:hypothetical protein